MSGSAPIAPGSRLKARRRCPAEAPIPGTAARTGDVVRWMRRRRFTPWRGWSRLCLIVATLAQAAALHYAHIHYLNPWWWYYGFSYEAVGWREIALGAALLLLGSVVVPDRLLGTSSIVLVSLFIGVYIPAIVFSLSVDTNRLPRYAPILTALATAFILACILSRWHVPRERVSGRLPGGAFLGVVLILWLICGGTLLVTYHSVMSLVSLQDVYEQRAAGASTSALMGYVQTYFAYVLSPALIAIGLGKRRFAWMLLGASGCLIMYMIDAQRTVILLPAAIIALHLLLRSRFDVVRTTAFALSVIAVLVFLSARFYAVNDIAGVFAQHMTLRTLSFPGLTYPLYYDLFSRDGFTWWSHVKGFNLFIPIPPSYANEPRWPAIGYIVADRVHNMQSNANANLFAGDGVAAAGALGTLLIGLVLGTYLRILEYVAAGWNRHFTTLLLLPLGITLINGTLFTTLLSYGGLFWLMMLFIDSYAPVRLRLRRASEKVVIAR